MKYAGLVDIYHENTRIDRRLAAIRRLLLRRRGQPERVAKLVTRRRALMRQYEANWRAVQELIAPEVAR
jgi:hypothetical protein